MKGEKKGGDGNRKGNDLEKVHWKGNNEKGDEKRE